MKGEGSMFNIRRHKVLVIALGLLVLASFTAVSAYAQTASAASVVRLTETQYLYILENGIVAARVAKASGDIVSLKYRGREMFATILQANGEPNLVADPPGENLNGLNRGMTDHQYGFWSHDAMGRRGSEPNAVARVTIDPKDNGGEWAEVSVKGISNGKRQMGTGPGAARGEGDFYADVEIRYAMGRGDSGVYTYCIFEHQPEYPADAIGEARFCMKLNDFFDWMLTDAKRNKLYPKTDVENKYNYTANQFENRAFGWAAMTEKVGCFLINASMEYMSGGPTKVEFLCHRDTNRVAAPCVLNYWRSSHYGGALVSVNQGEYWTKVIGPFLIYCNAGSDPQAIYQDAIAQQTREIAKWPYQWVKGVDYPGHSERGTVKGRLVLHDPLMPNLRISRLLIGLTHPEYEIAISRPGGQPMSRRITWQQDAKYYQFWVSGDEQGQFTIPNVRPGTYTLHALADGVLGAYTKADVTIESGKTLDLGSLEWTPVRRGRQVWDIGVPNRSGKEFLKGDDYFHDGMPLQYAKLFPHDINFVIGKSDFSKDWYFEHVPHANDPNAQATFFNPGGNGKATPWQITFNLPAAPHGKATLRLAICGTGARSVAVTVNDQPAGQIDRIEGDGTVARNGISGIWFERELPFDASLLKSGPNILKLTVPPGSVTAGVIYDYLRLELED
jgi:rhamnogalacturonan endolyase